ncbi:MAG: prepilin-type N-terminal cleavage/methylation domain-containing protein [Psychromonas sp.]|nr:prepilin-type N-terminal cleavage/methylation domain-containing protein [Psychromonas sp.]
MKQSHCYGFSFVEILVAIFVASIASVGVYALQKMVIEQNRDNVAYKASFDLATEQMANALKLAVIDDIDTDGNIVNNGIIDAVCDLNGKTQDITKGMTTFGLVWTVSRLDVAVGSNCNTFVFERHAGDTLFEVQIAITWKSATGQVRSYNYIEQINPFLILSGLSESDPNGVADIVVSLLNSNNVIYFEPKMGYKKGAFVIYNSQLYQATKPYKLGNGHPRDVDTPNADGTWQSFGLVNDPALLENIQLVTLLEDEAE